MTDHFTTLRRVDAFVQAHCPEHGPIGLMQTPTKQGFNALIIEARAHDDMKHGVFRNSREYRQALVAEAAEWRAALA